MPRWNLRQVDGPDDEPFYDGMESDKVGKWVRQEDAVAIALEVASEQRHAFDELAECGEQRIATAEAALAACKRETARECVAVIVPHTSYNGAGGSVENVDGHRCAVNAIRRAFGLTGEE